MAGYYDVILGLIPLSLAGITGALVAAGLALTTAVPLASLVALVFLGHAMFVNGPVEESTDSEATQNHTFSAD